MTFEKWWEEAMARYNLPESVLFCDFGKPIAESAYEIGLQAGRNLNHDIVKDGFGVKCYFCDKKLAIGKNEGFVCICDKCLEVTEKSEARMVKKVYELAREKAALANNTDE